MAMAHRQGCRSRPFWADPTKCRKLDYQNISDYTVGKGTEKDSTSYAPSPCRLMIKDVDLPSSGPSIN